MGKRKVSGWLGEAQERGRSTKPMTPEKLAVRWRQFVAKTANRDVVPITNDAGTRLYPTPKNAPDITKIYG